LFCPAFRLISSYGLKSHSLAYCSAHHGGDLDKYSGHTTTVDLKEVTKIEVYEGTTHKDKGSYVACMVFYKGQTIVGAPYAGNVIGAGRTLDTIKASFIDQCPGNNFQL
jgi:hypothetical protein